VNCGVTASTVKGSDGVVYEVVGPTPVIVTVYPTVGVVLRVVIVAVALAGGVTDAGLTVHVGPFVVTSGDVAWQLNATVPLNPPTAPIWRIDDDVPLGAIASGLNAVAVNVNSLVPWAEATGTTAHAASRLNTAIPKIRFVFNLDLDHSDFNMRRFRFT